MLGVPLSSREWKIPASSGTCKELMAAYMAEAKAANRQVTKNQKKKLKRKFKKQLSMGQSQQTPSMRGDEDSSAACLSEVTSADGRQNGANPEASGVAESQECSIVRHPYNLVFLCLRCHTLHMFILLQVCCTTT
jgi:hypothetical protein